jgi:ferritin-like metal-binding protein YciE
MNDTTNQSTRYDSSGDTLGDNEKHSLQAYVSDLLALEQHIGKPLDGQLASDATKQYAQALAVVQSLKTQNEAHQAALKQCLDNLGGHPASPVKSAWSSLLGGAAAAIGAARKTKVTKWLRDDYTALNLAAMSYTLLHATAVGLGDSATAAVAKQGLADYARSVMQINQCIPDVVLGELREDGETVQTGAAETIRRQTNEVWKSQSSVAN